LVVYAYALYPILVWALSRVFGRRSEPPVVPPERLPTMTVLIAAHNEEAVISARLENALRAAYPPDRLSIVVASDGCSDGSVAAVERFADRGVRLFDFRKRRGKAATLNDAIGQIHTDLVLLSDANTHIDPAAPRRLASWFADDNVGAVCGRLIITDAATGKNVDSLYWKYETFLKRCEGRLGALLGSNGAIYAIRKSVYVDIPNDTIVDDFVIPLLAKQQSGCRIVYDCGSVASEESAADVGAEFRRRARIGAGGFQAIGLLWRLLNPARGWVAFTFFSHKILRWLCPFFLVAMLLSNAALWHSPLYRALLAGQAAFYLSSIIVSLVPSRVWIFKPLRLAPMFTGMNLALLVGFWRWLRGRQKGTWERTIRLAEVNPAQS
jgi:cellulose synthase/poly-beta-1,6-N-acetylglucosamine synthase-like glycosyltransferase